MKELELFFSHILPLQRLQSRLTVTYSIFLLFYFVFYPR
jgi:hypothetical protein